MKTAVCLVVKNEDTEIVYWVAWYKALGFDSFIIYDDFSDDATEKVILSLRRNIDIRYMRNVNDRSVHDVRQIGAYNDAVSRYGAEFDWIALFDADEYLDLYGKDIKTWLSEHSNASLVAFNWCCVGTNGYVSRPSGCPVFAYTRHGADNLFWNRHTKVIFRPKDLAGPIIQVHNVPVNGLSVASDGAPVQWDNEIGGLAAPPPGWAGGRLFHYQSRSLEHYVRRDRHLEDRRRSENDPLQVVTKSADYNAIPYTVAENYRQNYLRWLTSIIATQTRQIAADLRACPGQTLEGLKLLLEPDNVPVCRTASAPFPTQPGIAASSPVPGSQSFVIFHLTNYFGQKLGKKHGMLTVTEPDAAPLTGLYIFGSPVIHLFTPDGESIMIGDDPRLSSVITWTVWSNTNGTISLSHPATERFLSFAPDGSCTSRKMRPLEWEHNIPFSRCHRPPALNTSGMQLLSSPVPTV